MIAFLVMPMEENSSNTIEEIRNLLAQKQYEDALKLIEEALRSDPDNDLLRSWWCHYNTKLYKDLEAIMALQNVMGNDCYNEDSLIRPESYHPGSGEYNQTPQAYDLALKLDREYINILFKKAKAMHKLKRYGDALNYYYRVLNMDSKNVGALINVALLSHELGENLIALDLVEKALRIEPDNEEARDARDVINKI